MKTFTFISNAFRDLAAWIQGLAEAEAERYSAEAGNNAPTNPLGGGRYAGGASAPLAMTPQQQQQGSMMGGDHSGGGGSGFLMGGGMSRRVVPGAAGGYGYGGSGLAALKARGLPELVGLPDFFLELHQRFVQLLLELGVVLSS